MQDIHGNIEKLFGYPLSHSIIEILSETRDEMILNEIVEKLKTKSNMPPESYFLKNLKNRVRHQIAMLAKAGFVSVRKEKTRLKTEYMLISKT